MQHFDIKGASRNLLALWFQSCSSRESLEIEVESVNEIPLFHREWSRRR